MNTCEASSLKTFFRRHLNSIKSGADYLANEFNGSDQSVTSFNPSTSNMMKHMDEHKTTEMLSRGHLIISSGRASIHLTPVMKMAD